MSATRKLALEIPEALAARIDAQVASGAYADPHSLVLDSLQAHLDFTDDPGIERWLHEAVLPTLGRLEQAGPADLTSEEVFGGARERYLARKRPA